MVTALHGIPDAASHHGLASIYAHCVKLAGAGAFGVGGLSSMLWSYATELKSGKKIITFRFSSVPFFTVTLFFLWISVLAVTGLLDLTDALIKEVAGY
jgi:hypothetical protein